MTLSSIPTKNALTDETGANPKSNGISTIDTCASSRWLRSHQTALDELDQQRIASSNFCLFFRRTWLPAVSREGKARPGSAEPTHTSLRGREFGPVEKAEVR
jgi:hypothetical protein